jgi:pimeloyl-ACP methyl ester carboxylesterase
MATLKLDNANINYTTIGSGPLLVCIPGANGEHGIFTKLAEALSDKFQVLTYDRRGFSESILTGPQDYTQRLQTDADDVAKLIAEVGSGDKAYVFGSSSGAIVAMQLLLSHSESIAKLIAHEPPTLQVLPDAQELIDFHAGIYDLYRQEGLIAGQIKFASHLGEVDRKAMSHNAGSRGQFGQANATYWFERELPVYPLTEFDTQALQNLNNVFLIGAGTLSDNSFAFRCAQIWAERLNKPAVSLEGGHVGYVSHPNEYAKTLTSVFGV